MALNINQRLNGLHSLSYMGDNAVQPPDFVTKSRAPNSSDSKNFALGDIWLDTTGYPNTIPTAASIYMLVALIGNQATWVSFGAGTVTSVTAGENLNDSGTATDPIINLNRTIHWPNTTADGLQGAIYLGATCAANECTGGTLFLHNYGTQNVFLGSPAGNLTLNATTSSGNVGIGNFALSALTAAANNNVAIGFDAGSSGTIFGNNVFVGANSGQYITSGTNNTFLGFATGNALTFNGDNNIFIGQSSGGSLTGTESNNVFIGSTGSVGDNFVLRIHGGNQNLQKAFIDGIRGVTTTNNNAIAVLIDSAGQLGTVSSSARYKDNIENMGHSSHVLHHLRPVTFNYKQHSPESKSVGLIAEEVAIIAPQLVVYDKDGLPETVKYQDLVPMLLNELQKLNKTICKNEIQISELVSRVQLLESK